MTPTGRPAFARLFPLGLIATGYLSQQIDAPASAAEANAVAPSITSIPPMGLPAVAHPAPALDPTESGPLRSPTQDASRLLPIEAVTLTGSATQTQALQASTSLTPLAAAIAPLSWPERLLRLCPDPDGGTSLWLRDYRIDPQHVSALGEALARQARAAGHPVRGVYINGHPVWSDPSPAIIQET